MNRDEAGRFGGAKFHPSAKVADTALFFGDVENLEVGPDCRIDAFAVITVGPKGVKIGRNVHVGAFCFISGAHGRVEIGDFCSLSPRATIYTATDDMAADCLVGACAPEDCRKVISGDVTMMPGSAVATNGIVFPGVTLEVGAVVGANSMAWHSVEHGDVVVKKDYVVRRRDWRKIAEMIRCRS